MLGFTVFIRRGPCVDEGKNTAVYRRGRVIEHFTVHGMVGYILSGSSIVILGVSCELLRS